MARTHMATRASSRNVVNTRSARLGHGLGWRGSLARSSRCATNLRLHSLLRCQILSCLVRLGSHANASYTIGEAWIIDDTSAGLEPHQRLDVPLYFILLSI